MRSFYKNITMACMNLEEVQKDFETLKILNSKVMMKDSIVKTYEAEDYYITWGTMEDVMSSIDLTVFEEGSTDDALIMALSKIIVAKDTVYIPIIKDIFEGISDEEIRNARVTDIARVFVGIVKFNIAQLSMFEDAEKN